jgi:two-component system, OmpR family, sensor histidine kinase CpxA
MHGLFPKIFLWFLLGSTLVVVSFVLTSLATPTGPGSTAWREAVGGDLAARAGVAAETYRREGPEATARYLDQMTADCGTSCVCLFDENGAVVAGSTAPPRARELALMSAQSLDAEFQIAGSAVIGAASTAGEDGRRYTLVMQVPGGVLDAVMRTPGIYALRLGVALAVAGLVCYGLAWYLTAPIVSLRGTTRKIAGGALGTRVDRRLSRRRDEVGALGRDFDTMADRFESLLGAERRLLCDISHELRSPLARLSVALGIARRRYGSEPGDPLDRIERETVELDEMIGHLLELARLEHERSSFACDEVDLGRLSEEVVTDCDFEAQDAGRAVRLVQVEECAVAGDERPLRSALENVIRNAVRYTPEGREVSVTLGVETIDDSRYVRIRVRDFGPGIPEAQLADVFRPFYRVADSRDRESGGVGLGLAIVERAVRHHGGRVKASNAEGGGLEVEILLPAARAEHPRGERTVHEEPASAFVSSQR